MTGLNSERRIGLARAISKLGYCSRSRASELIRSGRVALNGRLRRDPESPVRLGRDRIAVDGRTLEECEKVYLMLNKPRGEGVDGKVRMGLLVNGVDMNSVPSGLISATHGEEEMATTIEAFRATIRSLKREGAIG